MADKISDDCQETLSGIQISLVQPHNCTNFQLLVIPPFHWPALPLQWQNWSRLPRSTMDRCLNRIQTAWAYSSKVPGSAMSGSRCRFFCPCSKQEVSNGALWRSDKKRHSSTGENPLSQGKRNPNASITDHCSWNARETPKKLMWFKAVLFALHSLCAEVHWIFVVLPWDVHPWHLMTSRYYQGVGQLAALIL